MIVARSPIHGLKDAHGMHLGICKGLPCRVFIKAYGDHRLLGQGAGQRNNCRSKLESQSVHAASLHKQNFKHSTSSRKRASKRSLRTIMASTTSGCCHPWASRHPCRPPSPSVLPFQTRLFHPSGKKKALAKYHFGLISIKVVKQRTGTNIYDCNTCTNNPPPKKKYPRPFLLHEDFLMRWKRCFCWLNVVLM